MIRSLFQLHSKLKIHRNIKLGNFLIDSNNSIKLSDLWFLCDANDQNRVPKNFMVSSSRYWAPEILRGAGQSTSSDIWALGVILLELAFGANNFSSFDINTVTPLKIGNLFSFSKCFSKDAEYFISKLFESDPKQRPNILHLSKDPWISMYLY